MIDVRYASDIARGPLFILGGAGEGSLEERRRSQATLSTLLHRLDNTCPLFFTTMWKQRTPPVPLRWVSLVIETAALRPLRSGYWNQYALVFALHPRAILGEPDSDTLIRSRSSER